MTHNIQAQHIRYIKCGPSGTYWPEAKTQGWVPVGYAEIPFELSASGDQDAVR